MTTPPYAQNDLLNVPVVQPAHPIDKSAVKPPLIVITQSPKQTMPAALTITDQ